MQRLTASRGSPCRLVVLLGSLCCACGYLGLYLLASGAVEGNFVYLILFAACAGKGLQVLLNAALQVPSKGQARKLALGSCCVASRPNEYLEEVSVACQRTLQIIR
jgi:hypothetical protein